MSTEQFLIGGDEVILRDREMEKLDEFVRKKRTLKSFVEKQIKESQNKKKEDWAKKLGYKPSKKELLESALKKLSKKKIKIKLSGKTLYIPKLKLPKKRLKIKGGLGIGLRKLYKPEEASQTPLLSWK